MPAEFLSRAIKHIWGENFFPPQAVDAREPASDSEDTEVRSGNLTCLAHVYK